MIKIYLVILMLFLLAACSVDDDDDDSDDGAGVPVDPATLSCADMVDYYAECRIALTPEACEFKCLDKCFNKPSCDEKYYCLAAFCREGH